MVAKIRIGAREAILTPGPASGLTPPRHPQAVTGCEDCLAALLDHDAFVLCRDFKGRTPIHLASACGHTAVLRTLLQAALSTDPLDTGVDYSGYSPMHWASYTGVALGPLWGQLRWGWREADKDSWVALDLEVEWGVKRWDRPMKGVVVLFLSITTLPSSSSGHEDCLELLLEHSPFSYLEGNPFTPLHCAV